MIGDQAPEISIIIPHYNDLASLDRCLTSLEAQTIDPGRYEIIVADNMSPSGLAAVEDVVGERARVVSAEERGAGPARNAGLAQARGTKIGFIDCDCVAEPEWLHTGLAALKNYDLVGGRMSVLVADGKRKTGAEAFECVFAFDNEIYVLKKGFSVTANLFCSRNAFENIGAFRTGVSEDLDWCHRATALGYKLGYAEKAIVGHPARADWAQLRNKWARLNAETYGLFLAKSNGRLRWLMRNWLLPVSVLAHAPAVMRSPALESTGERIRGLWTLARLRMWRFVDAHRLLLRREP